MKYWCAVFAVVAFVVLDGMAFADGSDEACAPCKCGDGCKKPKAAKPKPHAKKPAKPVPSCCETLHVKERLEALEARLLGMDGVDRLGRKELDALVEEVENIRRMVAVLKAGFLIMTGPESAPADKSASTAELAELRTRLDTLEARLAALPKAKSVVTVGIESSFLWTPRSLAFLGGLELAFRTPGNFELAVRAGYEALTSGTFVGGSVDWFAPKPVRFLGAGVTVTGVWTHVFDSPGNSARRQILAFGLGPRLRIDKWDLVFGVDALLGDDRDATSSVIFFGGGAHIVTTFDLDF